MPAITWLDKYYGKAISSFRPTTVFDGDHFAVVRVYSGRAVGYVLLKKAGKHNQTPAVPLHDGPADKADFAAMKKALDDADR
jgi:hypothetical protein